MDGLVINSPIYIAAAETDCWKCKSKMKVVAIIAPKIIGESEGVGILSNVTRLPEFILQQIQKINPYYQLRYSKMAEDKYFANVCPHCDVISGDFFLHSEPGEAFFPTSDEEVNKICLMEIKFDNSIEIVSDYGVGLGEYILTNGKYM